MAISPQTIKTTDNVYHLPLSNNILVEAKMEEIQTQKQDV